MPVFQDAFRGVGHVQVGRFDEVPDAIQLPLDLFQLGLDGLQVLALFPCHSVHLLVQQFHQVADIALGEDVLADVGDDDLLKGPGVEPGRVAGPAALFENRLADVVGVLAALGLGSGEGFAAGLALGQAAEQVGAGGAAGVGDRRRAGFQQSPDPPELLVRDDGGKGVHHPHRFLSVLGSQTPDQGAGVGFVGEDLVDGGLAPLLAVGGWDALGVEGLEDVQGGLALEGEIEDASYYGVVGRVQFQAGALLGAVLDVEARVSVGGAGVHPEAPGGGLAHSPRHFLRKILAIKFVHGLDDGLHQLAGGGVVGVLGDGDHADALAPEHGLVGHGVFPLAGEATELPDQDMVDSTATESGVGESGE